MFHRCRCPGLERLENHQAFIRPPTLAMLPPAQGPLEALLNNCVVRTEVRVLSLSLSLSLDGGRYFSTFKIPKESEVATNHWVFLRYDWSPVSS